MKIAVCVKQVPVRSEGTMNTENGSILRTGTSEVNPSDLVALEFAARVKETWGGTVDVFTMGPEKAEEALRTCFEFGADRGFLICDPAFAGADVLATSYTISQGIRSQNDYDLVICGSQTTDGDTGQVSGALSGWLGFSFFNGITEISQMSEKDFVLNQKLSDGRYTWRVRFPCVISVCSDANIPRIPSLKAKLAARRKTVQRLTLENMEDFDKKHYGFYGSATKVKKIYTPERKAGSALISNEGGQGVEYIYQLLREMRII